MNNNINVVCQRISFRSTSQNATGVNLIRVSILKEINITLTDSWHLGEVKKQTVVET